MRTHEEAETVAKNKNSTDAKGCDHTDATAYKTNSRRNGEIVFCFAMLLTTIFSWLPNLSNSISD